MKYITFTIIIAFALGCSKQDKNSNQTADSTKTGGSSTTENVKQTSQSTSQPVKTYKKGEAIELYDLIYMFLPDENETTERFNWDKLDENSIFKLDKKNYNEFDKSYYRIGNVLIAIDGKIYKNATKGKDWDVNFEGNEKGWSIFDLIFTYNHSIVFDYEYYVKPENLFSSVAIDSKQIYEDSRWYQHIYEIKFSGKRTVWLQIKHEGNKIPVFKLSFYLNEKEVDKDRY